MGPGDQPQEWQSEKAKQLAATGFGWGGPRLLPARETYNACTAPGATREGADRLVAKQGPHAKTRETYNTSTTNGANRVLAICTAVMDASVTDQNGKTMTPFMRGGLTGCVKDAMNSLVKHPLKGDDGGKTLAATARVVLAMQGLTCAFTDDRTPVQGRTVVRKSQECVEDPCR